MRFFPDLFHESLGDEITAKCKKLTKEVTKLQSRTKYLEQNGIIQ